MHNDEDLSNRIWKLVQGGDDPGLQQRLTECGACQREYETLQQLAQYQATAGGALIDPPDDLMTTLSGLLERVRPDLLRSVSPAPSLGQKLRTMWAELLQDTGLQTQIAGLRSDGDKRTRQFAFVSDVADLDLEVTATDSGFQVFGQLGIDEVPDGLTVRLVDAEDDPIAPTAEDVVEVPVDDRGYFHFTADAGDWVVVVPIDDAVVLFPGVHL